jgi:hypothetical protein
MERDFVDPYLRRSLHITQFNTKPIKCRDLRSSAHFAAQPLSRSWRSQLPPMGTLPSLGRFRALPWESNPRRLHGLEVGGGGDIFEFHDFWAPSAAFAIS